MRRHLVIVGAGGFGREVLDVVEAINTAAEEPVWHFLGFLDDGDPNVWGRGPVLGPSTMLQELDAAYAIGIGDPRIRQRVDGDATLEAAMLIHPAATIGPGVNIGDGTIVTAGVRITNHISIGRHVHLNLNCTVGHDAVLGDYVTVNPGATVSGEVTLELGVTVGTNGCINQRRTVGAWSTIGSGAAVVRDIPPNVIAVGVPAIPRS